MFDVAEQFFGVGAVGDLPDAEIIAGHNLHPGGRILRQCPARVVEGLHIGFVAERVAAKFGDAFHHVHTG